MLWEGIVSQMHYNEFSSLSSRIYLGLGMIFVSFNSNTTRQKKNGDAKIIHMLLCILVLKIVWMG
jgi:hypothetical protein